ncbi:MAG: FtsQ-type POTRA domain-containing protein, partial [Candidatus Limnocylindrales bacterium]
SGRRAATPASRTPRPAVLRPGARPGGAGRRSRPVQRRSAGITPVRAGALLALLVAAGGLYGAVSSGAFTARATTVTGNTWTSPDAVLAALAVTPGQNVFTIRTTDLEARLEDIPAISGADVSVALPGEIRVAVRERAALVTWKVGDRTFLVDVKGTLFGELGPEPPAAAAAIPVIDDRRAGSAVLDVGSTLDGVSLDAALRLASLTPADVGSSAASLAIRIDDENGFVVRGQPAGWSAIFGFYTPTLRQTELIPGQVRLLRSMMGKYGEADVLRVILADGSSGTLIPRATPAASASPKP